MVLVYPMWESVQILNPCLTEVEGFTEKYVGIGGDRERLQKTELGNLFPDSTRFLRHLT